MKLRLGAASLLVPFMGACGSTARAPDAIATGVPVAAIANPAETNAEADEHDAAQEEETREAPSESDELLTRMLTDTNNAAEAEGILSNGDVPAGLLEEAVLGIVESPPEEGDRQPGGGSGAVARGGKVKAPAKHGEIVIGTVSVNGGQLAGAQSQVEQLKTAFQRCHEQSLRNPRQSGSLVVEFDVARSGRVTEVRASPRTGVGLDVAQCVRGEAAHARFSPPMDDVTLVFQVYFSPKNPQQSSVRGKDRPSALAWGRCPERSKRASSASLLCFLDASRWAVSSCWGVGGNRRAFACGDDMRPSKPLASTRSLPVAPLVLPLHHCHGAGVGRPPLPRRLADARPSCRFGSCDLNHTNASLFPG